MAVLLITYKCSAETAKADKAFYEVLGSYQWVKLYGSNYAITADEPARNVWQKLKVQNESWRSNRLRCKVEIIKIRSRI